MSAARRARIPFRAVNRRGLPGHDPGLQRHHLLPLQLLAQPGLARMWEALDARDDCFGDFRANGVLLPSCEATALRLAMPLHRGPHPRYSELVSERAGQIEAGWAHVAGRSPLLAREQAFMRLSVLQRALRRSLLGGGRRGLKLNRRDPLAAWRDFAELDAMADALWPQTAP